MLYPFLSSGYDYPFYRYFVSRQWLCVMSKQDALTTIATRNEFYRDGYRALLRVAIIEGFTIMLLILALVLTVMFNNPQDRYFATTSDGRLVPLVSLDQPNLTRAAVLSWTAQSSSEVMTFGFHDYRRRLQESSRLFTQRGWQSFNEALTQSRLLEQVEQYQQVVTATATGAPVVVQEAVINGVYRWVVQMPLLVTYQSGSKRSDSNLMVTLVIVRVPTLETPNGIAIEQWIATSR